MTRLLTTGCSYTFYKWNTWANYLSEGFDSFVNKGIPGCDNATIARNVIAMAEPHDVVVCMWTSYHRHNYKVTFDSTYNWGKHTHTGANTKDKYWFASVLNPYERFITTLDYIDYVTNDSKLRNYKVYHFSAWDMLRGELNTPPTTDILKKLNEKKYIVDLIYQPSVYDFILSANNKLHCIKGDEHPTELGHYDYVVEHMLPVIKECKNLNTERNQINIDKYNYF